MTDKIFPESLVAEEKLPAQYLNDFIERIGLPILNAGEAIAGATLPVPIAINKYDKSVIDQSQTTRDSSRNIGDGGTAYWETQTFTTSANQNRLIAVALKTYQYTLGVGNLVVEIFATSGGKPTGSALISKSVAYNTLGDASFPEKIITFDTELTVIPSTLYAIVCRISNGTSGYCRIGINTAEGYAGGTMYASSDSGASWGAAITDDWYFKTYGYYKQSYDDGDVISCDANAVALQDPARLKFHGFAITTASAKDDDIRIQTVGIVSGFTGLTPGLKYYVQDAIGTIGLVAGSSTMLVGVAISSTEILIAKDITKL